MHFRRAPGKLSTCKFRIDEHVVEYCNSYKYLGVIFQCHLNMNENVEQVVKSSSRALGELINMNRNNYDLSFKSFSHLYNSMVIPVLDYCMGSWNVNTNCKKLDQVHYHAM